MQDENMKKALQSRRGRGMDMSIILAPHEEHQMHDKEGGSVGGDTDRKYEESRKGDLAPMSKVPLDKDHGAGVPEQDPMGLSPLSALKDSDLLNGMNEYEMGDTATRSPRSLGERARRDAILSAQQRKK